MPVPFLLMITIDKAVATGYKDDTDDLKANIFQFCKKLKGSENG
jgi:hypothetical protein